MTALPHKSRQWGGNLYFSFSENESVSPLLKMLNALLKVTVNIGIFISLNCAPRVYSEFFFEGGKDSNNTVEILAFNENFPIFSNF